MSNAMPELNHRTIETNGLELHVVAAGPTTGEPVLALHGFPEFWYGWRHQIPALVDEGYRVIVPDQRGYNLSDKPTGLDAYRLTELAGDAVGLLDALGYEEARVLTHDWGAAVGWQILLEYPDYVTQAVTMNIPHPAVFDEYLFGDLRQTINSTYMFLFQLPKLSEWALTARDYRGLELFLEMTNSEDAFTTEDVKRYKEAWQQPGAVTGMLNWYRSLLRRDPGGVPSMTVEPETMVIWGTQDLLLRAAMAEDSIAFCPNGHLELIDEGTHWLHHECPARVNGLVTEFFEK
jgi:pimeloyl-ACP methyl ester carboxylesterase